MFGRPLVHVTFRCVNAGHCHDHVVDAVKKQAETMDFAPTFQMGHPLAFEYAHRLTTEVMPNKVHFTNMHAADDEIP